MGLFLKFRLRQNLLLAQVLLFLALPVSAAEPITLTLEFHKRPPNVALIYVHDASENPRSAIVDQMDKQFTSKMVVVTPGSNVIFKNSDLIDHNIFAREASAGARFDVGLMAPGGEKHVEVNWNKNVLVRVGCKIHPKMRMYIASMPAKFVKIVEFNRNQKSVDVVLSELPDNTRRVFVEIPRYEPLEISLEAGAIHQKALVKNGKLRGSVRLQRSGYEK